MTKIQLFLLSLVGALPAAYLSYLLIMYLINQPSGASSMVMIIAVITLLCSATITAIPGLVMGMYYSNYDPPRPDKPAKAKGKDKGQDEDVAAADEVEEVAEDEGEEVGEIEDLSSSEEFAVADEDEIVETEEEE